MLQGAGGVVIEDRCGGDLSRLDVDRGIDALLHAYRVRLDDVVSDALPFLGVTLVFPTVEISSVGLQNVIDPTAKARDKLGAGTVEFHRTDGRPLFCGGEGGQRDAVSLKTLRAGDISPHEMIRWNGNRLFQVDDAVRHDNASSPDDER
jgi:hypothetical protein